MRHAIAVQFWEYVLLSEALFNMVTLLVAPLMFLEWIGSRLLSYLVRVFEYIALLPFQKIKRALNAQDTSMLIELSVGGTTMCFGLWIGYGYGSPGIRMLLAKVWPDWLWILIVLLGLSQMVATGHSVRARCHSLGITLTLWTVFLGWLNAKLGLTVVHYLSVPLLVFGMIAVLLLMRVPYDPFDDSNFLGGRK